MVVKNTSSSGALSPLPTKGASRATVVGAGSDSESSTIGVGGSEGGENDRALGNTRDDNANATLRGAPYSPVTTPSSSSLKVLRETERCFLRKDYKRSLLLVHRYFRDRRTERINVIGAIQEPVATIESPSAERPTKGEIAASNSKSIRLVPSIRIPLPNETTRWAFLADATSPCSSSRPETKCSAELEEATKVTDQLAVIGLQSWYELSRMERKQQRKTKNKKALTTLPGKHDRWSLLVEILDFYRDCDGSVTNNSKTCERNVRGRLSMELLAKVWISFWESNGYPTEALAWTIQALHYSFHSRDEMKAATKYSLSSSRTIAEELWLRCVCQQIPNHLSNTNSSNTNSNTILAKKLFELVTERRTNVLDHDGFERIWEEINKTVNTENHDGNCNGNGKHLMMNAIIESIDSYLENGGNISDSVYDSQETLVTANTFRKTQDNASHSSRRCACVSRRTLLEARSWLLKQQEARTKKALKERMGRGEKINSLGTQQQQKQKRENPSSNDSARESLPSASSESTDVAANRHSSLSSERLVSEPLGPPSDMLLLQKSWKAMPGIGGLRQYLIAGIQALATISYRAIDTRNGAFGEIRARVLRLVHSSLAFAVREQPGSSSQTKQERRLVLRQHLQQALLTVVLFWAGWRGRKLLVRCGRALVWASLAPLRELIAAVGPPSSEEHEK